MLAPMTVFSISAAKLQRPIARTKLLLLAIAPIPSKTVIAAAKNE